MRENVKLGLMAAVAAAGALVAASPDVQAEPGPRDDVVLEDGVRGAWVHMPWCDAEDGRVDGRVCMWVDPGSGDGFVVTSENYR